MMTLAEAVAQLARKGEDYVIEAPPTWSQGRTLYGGMTAALCYEAAKRIASDLPPIRSAQLTFSGPASGALSFRPQLLRQGKSATVLAVDCRAGDVLAARAAFTFGAVRESKLEQDFTKAPEVPAPETCGTFFPEEVEAQGFFQNFDRRVATGGRPFTSAAPSFNAWVRFKDGRGVDPTTAMLALGDSVPPAAMLAFPQPGPVSTMTWTLDFARAPTTGEGWHLIHSSSERAHEGYSLQTMGLWDASGVYLGAGRQMVAIFV